jgi:hypothetical protein
MRKLGLPLSFVLLLAITSTNHGASLIELKDGSRIVGELVSVSQGSYLIRSTALGEIRLEASAIRSIRPSTDGQPGSRQPVELARIQQKIANSPELMKKISDLQSTPQIQAILNDKQLLQLVLSADTDSLQRDPRILQLLADPSVQAIIKQISGE